MKQNKNKSKKTPKIHVKKLGSFIVITMSFNPKKDIIFVHPSGIIQVAMCKMEFDGKQRGKAGAGRSHRQCW